MSVITAAEIQSVLGFVLNQYLYNNRIESTP